MFTNAGFKALAIGSSTTASNANSLTIQNLLINAPPDSSNQLLMNFPGLGVPLNVQGDLTVGPFASLVSHYGSISAGRLLLNGPATISDQSVLSAPVISLLAGSSFTLTSGTVSAGDLNLETEGAGGTVVWSALGGSVQVQNALTMGRPALQMPGARGDFTLSNAVLRMATLNLNNGIFTHYNGTNQSSAIYVPQAGDTSLAEYRLSGGVLISDQIVLGGFSSGTLVQSGGLHTNSGTITLWGFDRATSHQITGRYNLDGGTLFCGLIDLQGGQFTQSAGTNKARVITVTNNASYGLSGGSLSTSNLMIGSSDTRGFYSAFQQLGGEFAAQDRVTVGRSGNFALGAGTVSISHVVLGDGSINRQARFRGVLSAQGGTVASLGRFSFSGGDSFFSGQYQLGILDIAGGASTLGFGTPGSIVRFSDSHTETLSGGTLSIESWNGSTNGGGMHRLYVGTSAQGFDSAQLKQITFDNPGGLPPGTYPARILNTGEIVPVARPTLSFSRSAHGMVISWSGNYQLVTSTNVAGAYVPITGATSPYTVSFTDPRRFFQLRSP